jgi:hypothetical protein
MGTEKKVKLFLVVQVQTPIEVTITEDVDGHNLSMRIPDPVLIPTTYMPDVDINELAPELMCAMKDQAILNALNASIDRIQTHIKELHEATLSETSVEHDASAKKYMQ